MPTETEILKRRGKWFAALTFIFLGSCFIFAPLGGFFIWISIGSTVYCAFFSIYNFVIANSAQTAVPHGTRAAKQRKETEKERELREYIRRHLTILISMMLGALLLVIIFWLFFT